MIKIHPIKAFSDNYIWCIHNQSHATVVDPGDPLPVIEYLERKNLKLTNILITHHHYDHVNGLPKLDEFYSPLVYKPKDDRIPMTSSQIILNEDEVVHISDLGIHFSVLEVPGHTKSHIAYVNDENLFCGDTLFSLGCGRMFEGTPKQFHKSLDKFKNLNPKTKVYCTHEYTQSNFDFHQAIFPNDSNLAAIKQEISSRFNKQGMSLPSTIEFETENNLFFRTSDIELKKALNIHKPSIGHEQVFAILRQLKDEF